MTYGVLRMKYTTVNCKKIYKYFSWLKFNERVLDEAIERENPILERGKFLAIVSSNLDEFFEVRFGRLINEKKRNPKKKEEINKVIKYVTEDVKKNVDKQYKYYKNQLIDLYKKNNITICSIEDLSDEDIYYLKRYFKRQIFSVLTPITIDGTKPFPRIESKSLNICVVIEDECIKRLCIITIPEFLDRVIKLPSKSNTFRYVLIEDVIKINIDKLLYDSKILSMIIFRVTRSCDVDIKINRDEDILDAISENIKKQRKSKILRLEIEKSTDKDILKILISKLKLNKENIYLIDGPIDIKFLNYIYADCNLAELKFKEYKKIISVDDDESIFKTIDESDILIHLPFDSFNPIVKFVDEASKDSKVVAIKQTIYRVSENSPIVEALKRAAKLGKEVTAIVEVKARFSEEKNLKLVNELREAGCKVIYGVNGVKTHCKLIMVVRRDKYGLKRYINISTGNYNEITAQMYTDLSLFTCDPYLVEDISRLFNMITGTKQELDLYKTKISPYSFRDEIISLIDEEINNVKNSGIGRIVLKANGITDEKVIKKIIEAGEEGVHITLIVRGMCTLSEIIKTDKFSNIELKSVVGRFLEHSRIFYFCNNGDEKIYLSSADIMKRNLDRRIEVMVPIESHKNRERIKEVLKLYMEDEVNSRILLEDGTYRRCNGNKESNVYSRLILEEDRSENIVNKD
jgi:polyphosphate kinase